MNDPRSAYYLVKNEFTKWSWDLVKEIIDKEGPYSRLSYLLQNNGFFAQMGIGNIVETLTRLQELLKIRYQRMFGTKWLTGIRIWELNYIRIVLIYRKIL